MIKLAKSMCGKARAVYRLVQKKEFQDAFKNNPDDVLVTRLITKGDFEGIRMFIIKHRSAKFLSRAELIALGVKRGIKEVHKIKKAEIIAKLGI